MPGGAPGQYPGSPGRRRQMPGGPGQMPGQAPGAQGQMPGGQGQAAQLQNNECIQCVNTTCLTNDWKEQCGMAKSNSTPPPSMVEALMSFMLEDAYSTGPHNHHNHHHDHHDHHDHYDHHQHKHDHHRHNHDHGPEVSGFEELDCVDNPGNHWNHNGGRR